VLAEVLALQRARPHRGDRDACLLPQLAPGGVLEGLAGLDPAAGRDPEEAARVVGIGDGIVLAPEQEDAPGRVERDHAGGRAHDHGASSAGIIDIA
jgi:hypothetical protein